MNRLERLAWVMRWPLLAWAALGMLAIAWWVLPPELGGAAGLVGVAGFIPLGPEGMVIYYLVAFNYLTVLAFALRSVFPAGQPVATGLAVVAPPQRPMTLTVAMMAAALSTGAILTLLEAMDCWSAVILNVQATTLDTVFFRAGPGLAIAMLAWAVWIPILHGAWRQGDRHRQTGVALVRLSLSAMAMVSLAAMVHGRAMDRLPELPHAVFGSYTGLVLGMTVLAWCCLAAAIRLLFKRSYRLIAASQAMLADPALPRGRMSIPFRMVYLSRRLLFVAMTLVLAGTLWLLVTDILIRVPLGALALKHLELWTGHWLLPDHGIRGILGLYPATRGAHLAMSAVGLGLFLASQGLFEMPWRHAMDSLVRPGRLGWANAIGLAMPVAGLTVGAVAMAMEHLDLWSQWIAYSPLTVTQRSHWGVIIQPTCWIALPTLLGAWVFWSGTFRVMRLPGTRYVQRTQILFLLFVAAAAELFMAGMMQSVTYGYEGAFWDRGTFTALCMGAAVTLWTFLPSLRLIYAGQAYLAITAALPGQTPHGEAAALADDIT